MPTEKPKRWTRVPLLFVGVGLALMITGCGGGGGGGGARFVPPADNIEKVNGMSPSEAFHKNDRRR